MLNHFNKVKEIGGNIHRYNSYILAAEIITYLKTIKRAKIC
jgi:hypothetical protein